MDTRVSCVIHQLRGGGGPGCTHTQKKICCWSELFNTDDISRVEIKHGFGETDQSRSLTTKRPGGVSSVYGKGSGPETTPQPRVVIIDERRSSRESTNFRESPFPIKRSCVKPHRNNLHGNRTVCSRKHNASSPIVQVL